MFSTNYLHTNVLVLFVETGENYIPERFCVLNKNESLRVLKPNFYLRLTRVHIELSCACQLFKIFCNLARVPKNCKLSIFFLFFLPFRTLHIEMLHVFQKVESSYRSSHHRCSIKKVF